MIRFAALIALVLFLFSCKKEGTITGKVTSLWDGSPAENVEVNVRVYVGGRMDRNTVWTYVGDKTDANGEFSVPVSYKRRDKYTYSLTIRSFDHVLPDSSREIVKAWYATSQDYFAIDQEQDEKFLKKGSSAHFEFKAVPLGRLKIVVKDLPPLDSNNVQLQLNIDDPDLPYSNFYSGSPDTKGIDFGYISVPPVNNQVKLKWTVTKNKLVESHSATVALEPFKKAIYHISY